MESPRQAPKNTRGIGWLSGGKSAYDVGQDGSPLSARLLFTIQLAHRALEKQINIRSDDLIVITKGGGEFLSNFMPLSMDQIGKLIGGDGMFQNYPNVNFERE